MTDTPNPVDLHVGARIRARRKAMGMSQNVLAEPLNLTFQQLQKYERGDNRVSASKLFAIAQKLDVPVGWFFDGLPGQSTNDTPDVPALLALVGTRQGSQLAEAFVKLTPATQTKVVGLVRLMAGDTTEDEA